MDNGHAIACIPTMEEKNLPHVKRDFTVTWLHRSLLTAADVQSYSRSEAAEVLKVLTSRRKK